MMERENEPEVASGPLTNPARLVAVRNALRLDADAGETFRRLAAVAARTLHAPAAQVNILLDDRQISVASVGPGRWEEPRSVPIDFSYCRHVVTSGEPLMIEDAREHPLVRDNPATNEWGVVAYAAVPITVAGDLVLGTLCVIDFAPRQWTEVDVEMLQSLGEFVTTEIERRRYSEVELRHLSAVLESTYDAVIGIDLEGVVTSWNPGAQRLLGYAAGEIMGRPLFILAPAEPREELGQSLNRLRRGESIGRYEADRVRKDGSRVRVSVVATPVLDIAGRVLGSTSVQRDITKQAEAEKQLRRSQARFRALVEGMGEMITILDADGTIRYASPAVRPILGCEPAELAGRNAFELVHPDDRAALKAAFEEAVQNPPKRIPFQMRFAAADGSWRVLKGVGKNFLDDPAVEGVVTNARDVTEQQRDARALRDAEQRYQVLVEGIQEYAIFTFDPDGYILTWNIGAERLTGYTAREAVGRHFSFFYRKEDIAAGKPAREIAEALETGKAQVEGRRWRKDGSLYWDSETVSPLRRDGELIGFAKITQDVTTRREAEKALREAEEQLRQAQKMDAVGQLAAGIAHDFNNLLTAMRGNAQFLLMDLPPEHPSRDDAAEIQTAVNRAAKLTGQLLAFSRKQVLQPQVIDLNQLVGGIHAMLRRLINEDVELLTHPGSDLGRVEIDPGQMEQVLVNLAVNARDAMPGGGTLIIETENVELNGKMLSDHAPAVHPGEYVRLSVSDTGAGMTREVQRRIFEPFFTTKDRNNGTGLGLSTAYGIVRQSGGHIFVYSELGVGTTFKIYLPRVRSAPAPVVAAVPARAAGRTGTILLVEDDPVVRKIARRLLERDGHHVLAGDDVEEALRIGEDYDGPIHLLLTDVIMPGINGRELSERIRALRPEMKVLFMSGYTDDIIARHGVLDADTEFIQKPFSAAELAHMVGDLLGEQAEST